MHVHFHAASAGNGRRERGGIRDPAVSDRTRVEREGWRGIGSPDSPEKRGGKLIPTISRNSWKYRCPPGWRSARILALFAHFVSPPCLLFPFSLFLLSHPLAGASQFYRHVHATFSPLSCVWFPLSSTTQFTNRRLTVGKGGGRVPGIGTPAEEPPISDVPVGRKGWNERDPRLVTAQNGSPFDSRPLWLDSLVSHLLPDAHTSAASFAKLFNLPPSSPASPVASRVVVEIARYFGTNVYGRESAGVPRRYLKNVNFPVIFQRSTYTWNWQMRDLNQRYLSSKSYNNTRYIQLKKFVIKKILLLKIYY